MTNKKKIILFSSSYPYGLTETFLHNEVDYLKDYFDIEIYPMLKKDDGDLPRKLSESIKYFTPFLRRSYFLRIVFGLFNLAPVSYFVRDFFKMLGSSSNLKTGLTDWFLFTISYRTILRDRKFRHLLASNNGAIYYFYWGNFPFHLLPDTVKPVYIRVHGGEVNYERHCNYIPMAKEKFSGTSALILPISEDALNKTLVINSSVKYHLSRLGVKYYGDNSTNEIDRESITIVSCSNIIKLKRIHLIVEALSKISDVTVNWIHFGDGPLLPLLKDAVIKLPPNIKVDLKGRIPNDDVLLFYKTRPIDLFINVSETEGVPVSIMEALSFGIPCFATNVGGTGEILDKSGGMIVEKNFDVTILTDFICNIKSLSKELNLRRGARALWAKKCDYDNNYAKLEKIFNGRLLP